MLKEKRGEVTDVLTVVVTTSIMAIGLFVLAFAVTQIAGGLAATSLNDTQEAADTIESISNLGSNTIQNGFLFFHFALLMGVIITSFLTRSNPVFMFLYIFFGIVSVVISVYMSNVYTQIATSGAFAGFVGSQTFFNAIMNNLTIITVGIYALSLIIVFSKGFGFGGGADRL